MTSQKKAVIVVLIVVAALLAIGKFFFKPATKSVSETEVMQNKAETMTESADGESVMAADPTMDHDENMAMMALPMATVNTSYTNPGGSDDVSFTLTVDKDGVITKAETGILAKNPTSKKRQETFAEALPAVIVGKKLSELSNIDRVGGSSLTTNAFNASLAQLKSQI